MELKWDRPIDKAIGLIRERQYQEALVKEGYPGMVLIVGITYDKGSKEHTARIEDVWI